MRSKEFKRSILTDWLDEIEQVCSICGNQTDCCAGHIAYHYEEEA